MNTENMTPAQFWDKCRSHDWYYMMSDDGSVYRRGLAAQGALEALAKTEIEFQKIYQEFHNYFFTGPNWSGPNKRDVRPEPPARPTDET